VIEIDSDGQPLGLVIDKHTVVSMIHIWGRPYIPTLLRPQGSQTPNTLPLSTLANEMTKFGLGVDIDVISHGRRTASDTYADLYATMLADRPAAGQRSTVLVVRLDTRAIDTSAGLMWRTDTGAAAAAATRRIVRALRQYGCRAQEMTADQIRQAVVDLHGGSTEDTASTYREDWRGLIHRGTHISSYYLSAEDLTATQLNDMWAVNADQSVVAIHLRRAKSKGGEVEVSASVRFTTPQPQLNPPAVVLNRYTGRQWWALSGLLPGSHRVCGMPSRAMSSDLDNAVAIGPSGVLIGKIDDGLLMMPLHDPAGHTRIVIDADDDHFVRQLIRRAAASGETVAVYDPQRRWAMAAGSSRIWNTADMAGQPPRKPTMVVHNGMPGNYPEVPTTICVGATRRGAAPPDIHITHRRGRIGVTTERFTAELDAISFRNEQSFLN
jgi:type VII secretion protein EccE